MDQPLLFQLPPEVLLLIADLCFKEFRTACKLMKRIARPFPHALKETRTNRLILGMPDVPEWHVGDCDGALCFGASIGNVEIAKRAVSLTTELDLDPRDAQLAKSMALTAAVSAGHLSFVRFLVEDLGGVTDMRHAISAAATIPQCEILEYLLKVNPNASILSSIFVLAAKQRRTDSVRILAAYMR